jgi:hypothetical protein
MTYDRMAATPIAGEHCRFCGDTSAPLVKTRCCQQWICCDTAFMSFRGGGAANMSTNALRVLFPASIMTSATPSAYVRGKSTSIPKEQGLRRRRRSS